MKENKYNVAIIGAGNIGALKDQNLDSPKTIKPLTHAHAIYNDSRFNLRIIVEPDQDKNIEACKRWGCIGTRFFTTLNQNNIYPDIIVVASPTKTHYQVLMDILQLNELPKLVIIEKPFCWTMSEVSIINRLYKEQGITILVNYSRRYSHSYQQFYKDYLKDKEIQQIVVRYNRGLKHDGCHALDILNWWCGRCLDVSLNKSIDPIIDYPEGGRSYNISLKYEFCPSVVFIPMDFKKCGIFEMDIFTRNNRHIFANYGEYIINMEITENKTYGQKNTFLWNIERRPELDINDKVIDKHYLIHSAFQTDLHYNLKNLYDKVYEILLSPRNVKDNIATGEDALRVHNIIEKIDLLYETETM